MSDPWLAAAGIALLGATVVDIVWTTLAVSSGRGPLTRALSRSVWRSAVALQPGHRALRATGYAILLALLSSWVLALWGGLTLIVLADPEAVVDAATQQPADTVARMAFATGALAGAGAGFVAGSGGWELANNIGAVLGLATVTLAITYLLQVVTATTGKRAMALHISGLGESPAAILLPGVGDSSLGPVGSQIESLTGELTKLARQHLALPVIHYMHSGERQAAIEVAVARLDEAITVALHGLDGVSPAVLEPARAAIDTYVETAPDTRRRTEAPPPPDLTRLERAGVELDRGQLREALREGEERRSLLRGLVEQNGWSWQRDVLGEERGRG